MEKERSPLLEDLMVYLRELMKDYKNEVKGEKKSRSFLYPWAADRSSSIFQAHCRSRSECKESAVWSSFYTVHTGIFFFSQQNFKIAIFKFSLLAVKFHFIHFVGLGLNFPHGKMFYLPLLRESSCDIFKCLSKDTICPWNGEKYGGKRRKSCWSVFYPCTTLFLKGICLWGCYSLDFVLWSLTLSQTSPGFYVSAVQVFESTVGKGEIARNE